MSTTTTTAPAPLTVTKNGAPYVHDSDTFELHDFLASLEHGGALACSGTCRRG